LFLFKQQEVAKIASICLAISCRKIASELSDKTNQITSNYSALPDHQIAIAYLAIKERQIAKSI
jgi:hypothetical protein